MARVLQNGPEPERAGGGEGTAGGHRDRVLREAVFGGRGWRACPLPGATLAEGLGSPFLPCDLGLGRSGLDFVVASNPRGCKPSAGLSHSGLRGRSALGAELQGYRFGLQVGPL